MNTPQILHPNNVLLGVDGSDYCLAGVSLLKDLPCVPASNILALSVWATHSRIDNLRLQGALEQAHILLSHGCAEIKTELCQGHPAEELVETAKEQGSDLIVVGAQGLHATFGILLGGVAQEVVVHAPCPVLVVRSAYHGLHQILVMVDGSPSSQHAVEYLRQFSLPEGIHVRVCHVTSALGLPQYGARTWPIGNDMTPVLSDRDLEELEKLHEEERHRGRELVASTAERLREAGLQAEGVLLEGDPAGETLKYAKATHTDLIVAGSRGLSQIKGWLIGSVSRKLVNYADCSVLIVK